MKIDEDFSALTPDEVGAWVGHLARDGFDIVTTRHPDHPAAAYEQVGVTWLLEATSVGRTWMDEARGQLAGGPRSTRS